MQRHLSILAGIVLLTLLYFGAGKLGLSLAFVHRSASAVWPPTGLSLAALLLVGYRLWPGVWLGAFLVNVTTEGTSWATSCGIATGNTLEALVGAMLVNHLAGGAHVLERTVTLVRYVVLAAMLSTMISATLGTLSLALGGSVPWEKYGAVWSTWWLGDAVSALTVGSLLLAWGAGPPMQWSVARLVEGLGAMISVLLVALLVFGGSPLWTGTRYPLTYLALPPLLWAALRLGPRGAATVAATLSAAALLATYRGAGPFAVGDRNLSLLLLQAFMGVATVTALMLAALVTERQRVECERLRLLQAEQEARAEAERANQAKDHFLAMLSHELRTPLTPALLTAQLLESDEQLPPATRDHARSMRENIQAEARLINDLLDLTRIARGKLSLQISVADVHAALQRAIEMCRNNDSPPMQIELAAARHHVRGDFVRLQQVFWNLLCNAVKFTPRDGRIVVRTSNTPDGGHIRVEVSDTGIGIDPQVLPKIFDAFEQGDESVTKQFGGLGLGLAISKALIDAHGGNLSAHSEGKGRGATFSVTLATAPEPQPGTATLPRDGPPVARSLRILLVEDHEPAREVLALMLKRLGHDVKAVEGVSAALAAAEAAPFDLLVSDLSLRDGEGHQLMRTVKQRWNMPGIALSGYGMEHDLRASQAAGFALHLVKPVEVDRLRTAVEHAAVTPQVRVPP